MRHGSARAMFDLTDALPEVTLPIDDIDDALAVARSVLSDYAPDAACEDPSRLARLARFVVGRLHLDAPLIVRAGQLATYESNGVKICRAAQVASLEVNSIAVLMTLDQMRAATALLIAAVEDVE